jgi:hypothetical protein
MATVKVPELIIAYRIIFTRPLKAGRVAGYRKKGVLFQFKISYEPERVF